MAIGVVSESRITMKEGEGNKEDTSLERWFSSLLEKSCRFLLVYNEKVLFSLFSFAPETLRGAISSHLH